MKLLLTNPDALINPKTGEFYDGIFDVLDEFNSHDDRGIVVVSMNDYKLKKIPKSFNPLKVTGKQRKGTELLEIIESQLNIKPSGCIVLGTKLDDVALAANSKILLLRAEYARFLAPKDRLYLNEYGVLGIRDSNHLSLVLSKFRDVQSPWYYTLKVDDVTTLFSLTNANTLGFREEDAVKLANEFKTLLKQGKMNHFDSFALFFMISVYAMFEEFKDIDYWCVYPSSDGSKDLDLEEFVTKMRESFKKRTPGEILNRIKPVQKRRFVQNVPYQETIKNQIDSIQVNENIDLEGKCICVIDDFSTNGTSCEATRYLLKVRGVRKIIFISMGKFGKNYQRMTEESEVIETLVGTVNNYADIEFVKSLKNLM